VGAGSVVVKPIPAGCTAVGNPALEVGHTFVKPRDVVSQA
jgi:serine acetyltransferase